jgi:general secretion pathway protein D
MLPSDVGCFIRPLPRTLCLLAALALFTPLLVEAQVSRSGTGRTTSSSVRSGTQRGTSSGSIARSSSGTRQYRSNTELGEAMITIDPETRSLVIVTDEDTHQQMEGVIKSLDQPKPQVLIKVVFLEVTYNKGVDVGVEGTYTFNLEGAKTAATGTKTTTNTKTSGTKTVTSSLVETLGTAASLGRSLTGGSSFNIPTAGINATGLIVGAVGDDWSATLRALSTKGKVEVLSRPSIMARNNQEAVIIVGSEIPFITNSRIDNNGNTINTVTYDDIGIILRVTPFITSEGTVEMIVAPEISEITDQTVPISDTVSSPVISKRSAETVVVTPNGKTVVIGGLMKTRRVDSTQKVPLLGDIPILGFPFRRTIKSDEKTELMIFLTPTIVDKPESIDRVNADELGRAELVDPAFTQKEKDKFLDDLPLLPEADGPLSEMPIARATPVKHAGTPKARRTQPAPAKKPEPAPQIERERPAPVIRGKATPF